MNTDWLIEALDPLLFRDGRPFGPTSRAASVPLPPPSALAGAARTRSGIGPNGRFQVERADELKQSAVCGPLIVRIDEAGQLKDWLFPRPADATQWTEEDGEETTLTRSLPVDLGEAVTSSTHRTGVLPAAPVGQTSTGKPDSHADPLWPHDVMLSWLTASGEGAPWSKPPAGTERLPLPEPRLHVGIEPGRQTADDGMLFETEGRSWSWSSTDKRPAARLGMVVQTGLSMQPGSSVVGGERRLATWRPLGPDDATRPVIPSEVLESAREGFVRVILVTAGHYTRGVPPQPAAFHLPDAPEVVAQVVSFIVDGWQTTSGWDLARVVEGGADNPDPKGAVRGGPKKSRRLAPPGSVFFLRLSGTSDEREQWAKRAWLSPLSDDPQSARDGFGVVLLGTWSGRPVSLNHLSLGGS